MRVDVQNRLYELKDGAIAALIEARRHKAEKIAHWAERQLDRLGKAVPGEAVRTTNYEILADILRAYGRTKDPDAARVVVSYANSERYQVREAARQAVVLMGDVALWQLREAYEDVIGKRPRRDFGWDRTAREIFYEYDRLRIAVVSKLYESGVAAYKAGKLEEMGKAYDAVLARLPQFDHGAEMALGYYALAERLQKNNPTEAETALVRVERLTTDNTLRSRAVSLRETLVATSRLNQGILDTNLLQSAIDHDKSNHRASNLLTSLNQGLVESTTTRVRWLTSGAIGILSLFSILFVLLRRRSSLVASPSVAKPRLDDAANDVPSSVTDHDSFSRLPPRPPLPRSASSNVPFGTEHLQSEKAPAPVRNNAKSSVTESPEASAEVHLDPVPFSSPKSGDPFDGL
jgi:tetratricopeptide (TPR) repeat protein